MYASCATILQTWDGTELMEGSTKLGAISSRETHTHDEANPDNSAFMPFLLVASHLWWRTTWRLYLVGGWSSLQSKVCMLSLVYIVVDVHQVLCLLLLGQEWNLTFKSRVILLSKDHQTYPRLGVGILQLGKIGVHWIRTAHALMKPRYYVPPYFQRAKLKANKPLSAPFIIHHTCSLTHSFIIYLSVCLRDRINHLKAR